jgi:hypothetical protein
MGNTGGFRPMRRRSFLAALLAFVAAPFGASAQSQCPPHLWVWWGTDNRTGRTISKCMRCGIMKIG